MKISEVKDYVKSELNNDSKNVEKIGKYIVDSVSELHSKNTKTKYEAKWDVKHEVGLGARNSSISGLELYAEEIVDYIDNYVKAPYPKIKDMIENGAEIEKVGAIHHSLFTTHYFVEKRGSRYAINSISRLNFLGVILASIFCLLQLIVQFPFMLFFDFKGAFKWKTYMSNDIFGDTAKEVYEYFYKSGNFLSDVVPVPKEAQTSKDAVIYIAETYIDSKKNKGKDSYSSNEMYK